jgi:pseudaminic acid biosynthesis-associated methylase
MNTEQFWQGQFGNEYTARNINLVENNWQMFCKIFHEHSDTDYAYTLKSEYENINSIIEFGAGSGQNIQALRRIFPNAEFMAVEINDKAYKELKKIGGVKVIKESILDFPLTLKADLILSKGLLIHIHPDNAEYAFDEIYKASNKYILLCEYYSPNRVMIPYRGENDKLWKFDFIKPMLDRGCLLLDYGFVSKYDKYPQDDITWVLLRK